MTDHLKEASQSSGHREFSSQRQTENTLGLDDLVKLFERKFPNTREGLTKKIDLLERSIRDEARNDTVHSAEYYGTIEEMIGHLRSQVKHVGLPRLEFSAAMPQGYVLALSRFDLTLFLETFKSLEDPARQDKKSGNAFSIEDVTNETPVTICSVQAPTLSVSEYADRYNVNSVTVRQWIRRGKLRQAVKYGKEWRISILETPDERNFRNASYDVSGYIQDLPAKYQWINEESCDEIDISYGKKDDKPYRFDCLTEKGHRTFDCDLREKEKLELLLIGSPSVREKDSYIRID